MTHVSGGAERGALLAALVEQADVGFAVLRGDDLLYVLANGRYRAIAPGKEMIGRPFAGVFPEAADDLVRRLRDVLATGRPYEARDRRVLLARAPGAAPQEAFFTFRCTRALLDDGPVLLVEAVETTAAVERQERVAILEDLTRELAAGDGFGDLVEAVLRRAVAALGCDDGALFLLEGGGREARGVVEVERLGRAGALLDLAAHPHLRAAAASREPVYVAADEAPAAEQAALRRHGASGALVAPLVDRGACLGLLFVNYRGDAPPPSAEERDFAAAIAAQCGVALSRARERDERLARREQERAAEGARAIADAIPQLVWTADAAGNLELVNRRWTDYTGVTAAETLAAGWAAALHPDDRAAALEGWARAVAHGEAYEADWRLRAADGSYRWHLARAVPARGSDGAVARWFGTATDVHDKKSAALERAHLAELTERQAALLEEIFLVDPGGLAVLAGPELRFVFANRAYRAALAGCAGEVEGRAYGDVWHDEDRDQRIACYARVLATGEPLWVDSHVRRYPDGSRRVFSLHARRLPWAGEGAVLVTLWETTAIEEARARAERAARDAAARAAELAATLDAAADGLIIYAADGTLRAMNPAARRILRVDEGWQALGRAERYAALRLEDAAGRALPPERLPTARALRGELVRGVELRLPPREPDGRPSWVTTSAAPIRGEGGAITGVVTTFADTTPLHDLHEEREDLLRMVSHDLRSPLQVMMAQAEMLARAKTLDGVERRARAIRVSGERMARMIDELVDAARLEGARAKLQPRPVHLAPFVKELVERLAGAVDTGRVRVDIDPALPPALADPPALERVLVNLVTNALKYSPPGEEVLVTAESGPQRLALCVVDRGPGIAADEQPRLFDRYYRARTAGGKEGLGLGLYICRLLVEAQGGRISVASRDGHGSAFKVTVPRAPAQAGEMAGVPAMAC